MMPSCQWLISRISVWRNYSCNDYLPKLSPVNGWSSPPTCSWCRTLPPNDPKDNDISGVILLMLLFIKHLHIPSQHEFAINTWYTLFLEIINALLLFQSIEQTITMNNHQTSSSNLLKTSERDCSANDLQIVAPSRGLEDCFTNSTSNENDDEEIQDRDRDSNYSVKKTIPTFGEKPSKQLFTKHLTSKDLETLKEEDPFMYYSIPEVRKAVFAGKDVDLTTAAPVVKRRRVISYESADLPDLDHLREACNKMSGGFHNGHSMDMFLPSMQDHQ